MQYKVPCELCGSLRTRVVIGHAVETGIIRRRHCQACGCRWYTQQPAEQSVPAHLVGWHNKQPFLKQ